MTLREELRREVIRALTIRYLEKGVGTATQLGAYRELEWRKCSRDPVYFIEKYCKVKLKNGDILPFNLYPVQKQLVEDWRNGVSTCAVKARQIGVTTLAAAFDLWSVLFHDAKEWNIIAANEKKAREVIERIQPSLVSLPQWMLDRAQRRKGATAEQEDGRKKRMDATFRFVAGFSKMEVLASTEKNIAGAVGNIVWDEFTRHDDQELKWKLAVPTFSGGGMAVLIANGRGDDFFRSLYLKAKRGQSRLKAYFFDWMEVPERIEGGAYWGRAHIVNDDGTRTPVSYYGGDGFASKDEAMKAHLEGKLDCPWWEFEKQEYVTENPEADDFDFRAQYPSTEDEAFFITGNSRFPAFWANEHTRLARIETLAVTEEHKDEKGFKYPEVGFVTEAGDKDADAVNGFRFQHFISGRLQVWELPQPGAKYVLGIDPAGGKQAGDYSAIEVLKVVPGGAEQVAEYQAKEEPAYVAHTAEKLARFYNEAFVVIERNNHGHVVVEGMKRNYFNLYRHIDKDTRFGDSQQDTIGYPVQGRGSKEKVIDRLAVWLDCGTSNDPKQPQLTVRSQALIAEMPTFLIDEKTSKLGAPKGQTDDLIMATAHAVTGVIEVAKSAGRAPRKSYAPGTF